MANKYSINENTNNEVKSDEKPQSNLFQQAACTAQILAKWKTVTCRRRSIHASDSGSSGRETKADRPTSLLVVDEGGAKMRMFGRDLVDGPAPKSGDADRRLLQYFVKVSTPDSEAHSNDLDADIVEELIKRGADLNAKDRHGQTVLHEVAANWHPSVMDLMIECGGDPNAADYLGWTPLHVAAAHDYPEMCRTLVRRGANKEAAAGNGQTPLFFAAKTDSVRSLRALIRMDCQMSCLDYRGRTPLFAATELDRSATSAMLLEYGADAFAQDFTGQIAFVPLVEKMPPLAKDALQQLHETFRIERIQRLDLFRLDPKVVRPDPKAGETLEKGQIGRSDLDNIPYKSSMKAITETTNYVAIKSPVVQELIKHQWTNYGRKTAIWQIILQLITIILWTAFAVIKDWSERFTYVLPDEGYRIAILILAILLTLYNIADEITEYVRAKTWHEKWKHWRLELIERDLDHCHARHPEEQEYWLREMEEIGEAHVEYFQDSWNYLDWVCYIILLASIVTHFIDIGFPGGEGNLQVARWHVRIMAVNIVLLWLRLLKYVKPFEFFGAFIVMLGMIAGDLFKFFLLYLEFLIPFACIFWTILGGENNLREIDVMQSGTLSNYTAYNLTKVTVKYFDTVNNLLFTVFRITLVDDYDYANMVAIDQITAQILLGVWFAISTILFLNLFIAQLSESFKQVYDNAKAAAAMQKAITLNSYYESMLRKNRMLYHNHLEQKCNPCVNPYDDDVTDVNQTEEMQKATLQIREAMEDIKEKFDHLYKSEICDSDEEDESVAVGKLGTNAASEKSAASHYERLHNRVSSLESALTEELKSIKETLCDLAIIVAGVPAEASPRQQQQQLGESTA